MLEQLSTADLLHDYVHVVLRLIGLLHLNDVRMRYEPHNLYLFPPVVFVPWLTHLFVDHLDRNDLIRLFTLALINVRVLTTAKPPASTVEVIKVEVASLLLEMLDPLKYHVLIIVIQKSALVILRLMVYAEPKAVCLILAVLIKLLDVHSLEEYQILGYHTLTVFVYEQCAVSENVVAGLQSVEPSPDFLELTIHHDY